ncbi:MAG: TadE/TadG family type IV pilus assembly protein [Chloroflexota bacterium]
MDSKNRQNAQSMVEFALILPILMLLILGIFEGARLIQGYVFAQNASRAAARFAVAGLPADEDGNPWTGSVAGRWDAIADIVEDESIGTGYTRVISNTEIQDSDATFSPLDRYLSTSPNPTNIDTFEYCLLNNTPECAGVLGVYIEGEDIDSSNVVIRKPKDPGIEGLNIRVTVYHNVLILDPIYAAIAPGGFIRVRADTIMRNEGVDVSLTGVDPIVDQPSDPSQSGNTGSLPQVPTVLAVDDSLINPLPNNTAFRGQTINFSLLNHEAGTYHVWFNDGNSNIFVQTVTVDSAGFHAPISFEIPFDTVLGGRSLLSTNVGTGADYGSGTVIVDQGTGGFITINGNPDPNSQWPQGSQLTYQLFNHTPETSATLTITDTSSTVIHNSLPIAVDATGQSSVDQDNNPNYTLAANATLGQYDIGTSEASMQIEVVEACIKLDAGSCAQPATPIAYPSGWLLYIILEEHAFNHNYQIVLANAVGDNVGTTVEEIRGVGHQTNGLGKSFQTYFIGDHPDNDYFIATIDPLNNAVIAKKKISIFSPTTPYILLEGSLGDNSKFQVPAGTFFNYQLRNHIQDDEYDIYWAEENATSFSNKIATEVNTDDVDQWFTHQVPITTTGGDYDLYTWDKDDTAVLPYFGKTLYPIEVLVSPLIRIVGGAEQIPGSEITIELENHPANREIELRLMTSATEGLLVPTSPVDTDENGYATLKYVLPANLNTNDIYPIRSFLKGQTDNFDTVYIAETDLRTIAPDLTIVANSIELPANPTFNVPVPITFTLQNLSPVTITHSSFDIDIYIDYPGDPDYSKALPPGDFKVWIQPPFNGYETRVITSEIVLYGNYEHKVHVRADTSNRIIEQMEDNNIRDTSIVPNQCQITFTGSNFNQMATVTYGNGGDPFRLGNDSDSTGTNADSWNSNLIINEEDSYTNTSGSPETIKITKFNFFAHQLADPVTPFVVKVNANNDFTVVAIGATRDNSTYAVGENNFNFSDGTITEITLNAGETIAPGFLDANADGSGSGTGSVIPYNNGGDEIWFTGDATTNSGSVTLNNPPTSGGSTLTNLNRSYRFNIDFATPGTLTVGVNSISMDNAGTNGLSATFNDDDEGYFFAYQQMTGDFTVRVRLDSQTDGGVGLNTLASYGLEIRSSLAPDADKLQWTRTHNSRLATFIRDFGRLPGIPNDIDLNLGTNDSPIWLQIVKQGDEFTLSYAVVQPTGNTPPETVNWKQASTVFIPNLGGDVYLGIMNSPRRAANDNVPNTATFSNFHVCGNASGVCGPVRESDGLVVIDASNYVDNRADSEHNEGINDIIWSPVIDDELNGIRVPDNDNDDRDDLSLAAKVTYAVDISTPGTYYVWLLGRKSATDASDGDELYFGLDADEGTINTNHFYRGGADAGNDPVWFKTVQNGGSNAIDLTVGENRLSAWLREDGFELYQILLTQTDSGSAPVSGPTSQSQCAILGVPPAPAGLERCEAAIVNGDFENDSLMSEWSYSSIGESVTRTSVPHYFGKDQSFSMVLPDTVVGGIPRNPWLSQNFVMPTWIITPTGNAGASLKLSLNVGVNPEGNNEPDDLSALLRSDTGDIRITNPLTVATGSDTPTLVPPVTNNNGWQSKFVNLADGFDQPENILSYRGQEVQLYFEAPNPAGTDSTRFYLDNIEFEICNVEPTPTSFDTLVSGTIWVFNNTTQSIEPQPGVFVWIYAVDGSMQKTYTIQDSTFSFYNLPADPDGTDYVLYAETDIDGDGLIESASRILRLKPGQAIQDIAILVF